MDKAPRSHQPIQDSVRKGLIIVHTGEGKGKSTAAFGTALRSVGRGFKVAIIQFIKGNWKTGEVEAAKKYLGDKLHFFSMGKGFTWETKDYAQDVETAKQAWQKCLEVLQDQTHEVVIFDEINYCFKYNFLDPAEVIKALKKKPPLKHVIMTGNGAPPELIDIADLVTEMKCVKHPYSQGIKAQAGIEF